MEASNQFPRYQVIFSLVRCGFSRKTLSVMITFLPNVLCCLCQGRSSGRYCSFHSYQPCQLSRSGAARRPICCPPHALRTSCTLDGLEYRRISEGLVLRYVPAYSPSTRWTVAHRVLMHFCMEVNAPHIRFYSERIQGLGISFCIPDLFDDVGFFRYSEKNTVSKSLSFNMFVYQYFILFKVNNLHLIFFLQYLLPVL